MKTPERICVIAEGQLGDLLILSPALRSLKESFPAASLAVLVIQRRSYEDTEADVPPVLVESPPGGTAAVLRSDPDVDRVASVDREAVRALRGVRRLKAELSVVRWLRRGKFDTVVCTFPQDRFFLWAYLSGARVRVGEGGKALSVLLTCRMRMTKSSEGVLAYYCALAEAAGATIRSRRTTVVVPREHAERADAVWKSLGLADEASVVAVHPGASGAYRIWPPENYAALIDHLHRGGMPVLLIGSTFDRRVVEEVQSRCTTSPHVLFTSGVLDLAAFLKKCVLCVSNNSGPRHIAVAAGVPSLALIPRFDDVMWKIYADERGTGTMQSSDRCPACPATACRNTIPAGERYGSYCMRAITVDSVTARVDVFFGVPGANPTAG